MGRQKNKYRCRVNKFCKNCLEKIGSEINVFLKSFIDEDDDASVSFDGTQGKFNIFSVQPHYLNMLDHLIYTIKIPKRKKSCLTKLTLHDKLKVKLKNNQFILDEINRDLENRLINVILSLYSANETSSLHVSKSELDTLFLSSIDRNNPLQSEIDAWETIRSINLPWVGELNVHQILMLRHQASSSLGSLRENLLIGFMQGGDKQVTEIISELTSKVAELKQEIMANDIVRKSNKRYSARLGTLALTLVVFGLAVNVPAAAVGSIAAFLATLAHIHTSEHEQEEKNAKIITSPAYALLKAKDLLFCRERT